MEKLLLKSAADITLTFRDGAEALIDPAGNNVTVVVRDSAGVTVLSTTATRLSAGVYEVTFGPADVTAKVDWYESTWTATIDGVAQEFTKDHEVVGDFLFGIQEFRDTFSEFADTAKWTRAKIEDARDESEEGLEGACQIAFRPRGERVTLDGTGTADIYVPDVEVLEVLSATLDGTAVDVADLHVYPNGLVRRETGVWTADQRNVVIHYSHGLKRVPARVRKAAMLWAKDILKPRNMPDRATSMTTEEATFELGRPGDEGVVTGITEVDAVIRRFQRSRPKLGAFI